MGTMPEIQHWQQVDFARNIESIRNRSHWQCRIENTNIDWNYIMRMIDTHPEELYDWNREKSRLGLNRFHERGSAPEWAKEVAQDMHNFFVKPAPKKETYEKGAPHITNIAFCGFGHNSGSYPRHADNMDVFLVQVVGDCPITIGKSEEPSDDDTHLVMTPGDAIWIPRKTYHQLKPIKSRVTFSFGFESDMDCNPADFV